MKDITKKDGTRKSNLVKLTTEELNAIRCKAYKYLLP